VIGIGPIGAFFVGTVAVALAAPAVVFAITERPLPIAIPGALVLVAAGSSLAFLGASVAAGVYGGGLAVVGLLAAAAELAAASAIWLARAKPIRGDDDGLRRGPEGPTGPRGGDLPEECWRHWEEQFEDSRPLEHHRSGRRRRSAPG
jgi:hypothetical protein